MIEFSLWFFVLVANFLILFFVLNAILFKPLAKVLEDREGAIDGALNEAKAMTVSKEESIARFNSELLSTKNRAKETFDLLKGEGLARQKEVLSKTEAEAVDMIEKARKELYTETEKAKTELKAGIERLSEEIVGKLVKT